MQTCKTESMNFSIQKLYGECTEPYDLTCILVSWAAMQRFMRCNTRRYAIFRDESQLKAPDNLSYKQFGKSVKRTLSHTSPL